MNEADYAAHEALVGMQLNWNAALAFVVKNSNVTPDEARKALTKSVISSNVKNIERIN